MKHLLFFDAVNLSSTTFEIEQEVYENVCVNAEDVWIKAKGKKDFFQVYETKREANLVAITEITTPHVQQDVERGYVSANFMNYFVTLYRKKQSSKKNFCSYLLSQ